MNLDKLCFIYTVDILIEMAEEKPFRVLIRRYSDQIGQS